MKNKIFLFILFSISILWAAQSPYLTIKKVASPQYIEGGSTINFFIVITNTSNANKPPDYNITMIDDINVSFLANTNETLDDYNLTIIDEGNLSCVKDVNNSTGEIICQGLMIGGGARVIQYSLRAPNYPTQITNTASLTETDFNNFNISSSVTVTVFPAFEDTGYERDLCYEAPVYDSTCDRAGGFYYGSNCETSVVIQNQTGNELENLHIFKSYTSNEIYTDSCYVDNDTNTQCDANDTLDNLLHVSSSTYLENAFEAVLDFSLGKFESDDNATLTDIDSRNVASVKPNTDESIDYIVLIAQYQRDDEDNTIEEYIYPCNEGYGIPPKIAQTTSMQVNDVDMSSATLNTLNQATYIPYGSPGNGYKKVGTKIVKQPFVLGLTYLDSDGNPSTYTGIYLDAQNNPDTIASSILINYPGEDEDHPALWAGKFAPSSSSMLTLTKTDNALITTEEYPHIDEAFKDAALEIKFTDYSSFFNELGGYNCSTSVTQSSLCLVPACLNSDVKILEIFPIESYPKVAICVYGDGGGAAPCDSNAYTGHCGGIKEPISPADYNHDLGCAECLADATTPISSSDLFSVRPYSYSLAVNNPDADNPYRSGKNYTIDINATEYPGVSSTRSADYSTNELQGYNPPDIIAAIGLEYNATLSCPYDTNESQTIVFTDGYTMFNPIEYSNVGKTLLTIMDQDWTKIDQNITNTANSECLFDNNITDPSGDAFGRVGCRLMLQEPMTFVPFQFTLDVNLSDQGEDFTYLHDFNFTTGVPKMGADLNISIKAENEDGNVTSNYIDQCYAKENNVTLEFASNPDDNMTIDPGNSLTHFLYYNVKDGNRSSIPLTDKVGITSLPEPLVGSSTIFEPNAPDGNGTATLQYIINFNRFQHLLVNPIHMKLSDVNLTDIDGVPSADPTFLSDNATFQYAKAIPLKDFYPNVRTSVASTPILVHVYCTYGDSTCYNIYNIDTIEGTTPSGDWWISTRHDSARDGNITMKIDLPSGITEGAGTPSLGYPTAKIIADGIDKKMTVNRGTAPTLPMTVEIELDDAGVIELSPWLIYNVASQFNIPNPFFKVRFIEPANWTGVGATGHTVDTDSDINEKKRMDW